MTTWNGEAVDKLTKVEVKNLLVNATRLKRWDVVQLCRAHLGATPAEFAGQKASFIVSQMAMVAPETWHNLKFSAKSIYVIVFDDAGEVFRKEYDSPKTAQVVVNKLNEKVTQQRKTLGKIAKGLAPDVRPVSEHQRHVECGLTTVREHDKTFWVKASNLG